MRSLSSDDLLPLPMPMLSPWQRVWLPSCVAVATWFLLQRTDISTRWLAKLTLRAAPTHSMEQFVLFGDSLIQHSNYQERGFALNPGLQAGASASVPLLLTVLHIRTPGSTAVARGSC